MSLLILSLAMLLAAPFIYKLAFRYKKTWAIIEKTTRWLVALLVLVHLLPECVHIAGWSVLLASLVGLCLPSLFERLFHSKARSIHFLSVGLSLLGLIVHAMMDGAALNMPDIAAHAHSHHHHHNGSELWFLGSHALPIAVVLHRLPVGLFIWGLFYQRFGFVRPFMILLLNGLATVLGYFLSGELLWGIHDSVQLGYFQALFSGALLHIVLDPHGDLEGCEHKH